MSLAIVWFRRDLRLADQPALHAAAQRHDTVLPVYIHAPDEDEAWAPGAASRWWLHHALQALAGALHRHHGDLHVRCGGSLQTLLALVRESGASAVYWNRLYEPAAVARDTAIKQALREQGVAVHGFDAALWCSPWDVSTRQGEPYRVFTPFWRNLRTRIDEREALPVPQPLRLQTLPGSVSIEELGLLPRLPWADSFGRYWRPGEAGAWEALETFADDAVGDYGRARDLPARHGTSRLSPHLHFGEITPRQIHARLRQPSDPRRQPDLEPYLRELGWREFAHHLLYHFPDSAGANLERRFDAFPWRDDAAARERWQRGRTGIPIVDAGMRELWASGWMHNRVRMIVASLLTKNLGQHWLHGARWFWDTLVDADLASNTLGWQWVAGCGADAAPYFRIFNPVTQGRRFDPDGDYVRRWVPELASLGAAVLHAPWEQAGLARRCGYPPPLVDLKQSRQRALDAYQAMRGGA